MKKIGLILAIAGMAACGGDDGNGGTPDAGMANCAESGGAACFVKPTVATAIGDNGDMPANWACGAPVVDTATDPFAISGTVFDFESGTTAVGNATVDVFASPLDFGTPITTATADGSGVFTVNMPAGTMSRLNWRMKADGYFDTYELNDPVDVLSGDVTGFDRIAVAQSTAVTLAALIGVQHQAGLGFLAGAVRDCDRQSVSHTIATLSSTSSAGGQPPTFVGGAQVYYFSHSTTTDLPVQRTLREDTNVNGLFVIIEIPPTSGTGTYFLQVWGYKDDAAVTADDLQLLSEFETKVIGDSVIVMDMDPNQGP